jgi:hypothetical protein
VPFYPQKPSTIVRSLPISNHSATGRVAAVVPYRSGESWKLGFGKEPAASRITREWGQSSQALLAAADQIWSSAITRSSVCFLHKLPCGFWDRPSAQLLTVHGWNAEWRLPRPPLLDQIRHKPVRKPLTYRHRRRFLPRMLLPTGRVTDLLGSLPEPLRSAYQCACPIA